MSIVADYAAALVTPGPSRMLWVCPRCGKNLRLSTVIQVPPWCSCPGPFHKAVIMQQLPDDVPEGEARIVLCVVPVPWE